MRLHSRPESSNTIQSTPGHSLLPESHVTSWPHAARQSRLLWVALHLPVGHRPNISRCNAWHCVLNNGQAYEWLATSTNLRGALLGLFASFSFPSVGSLNLPALAVDGTSSQNLPSSHRPSPAGFRLDPGCPLAPYQRSASACTNRSKFRSSMNLPWRMTMETHITHWRVRFVSKACPNERERKGTS